MDRTTHLSTHPDRFNQMPTMTSVEEVDFVNAHRKEQAEAAGESFPSKGYAKLEHADFMKKVPEVLGKEAARKFFGAAFYANGTGAQLRRPIYTFPKREACLMAMSYSYDLQAKVFDRMTELEAKPALALPDFTNPAAAARAWADAIEATQALAIERDHAIATKAQIGNRREATAMATASAATRKAEKLMDQLGFNTHHATVIAVEGALGKRFGKQDWRPLKAWCKDNGASSVTVPCARYGKAQAWPAGAWGAVYGVDLVDLFGTEVQQ